MGWPPEIKPIPSRYRNPIGKFKVHRGRTTAQRQDWLADEAAASPALKDLSDAQWRTALDFLIERIKKKSAAAD